MRDKIGSVVELFTVIEMSGHSHRILLQSIASEVLRMLVRRRRANMLSPRVSVRHVVP